MGGVADPRTATRSPALRSLTSRPTAQYLTGARISHGYRRVQPRPHLLHGPEQTFGGTFCSTRRTRSGRARAFDNSDFFASRTICSPYPPRRLTRP